MSETQPQVETGTNVAANSQENPGGASADAAPDAPKVVDINEPTMQDFKKLGAAGYLMLLWAILPMVDSTLLISYMNTVGDYLRSHGTQGLVLYAAAFAVLAGCGLLPTYLSALLGGWAFGFERGLPAALAGFLVASLIGRAIAKPTSKGRVEALIAEKPKWKAVRDALIGGSPLKTFGIVTLLRVPPNSPFAITNFLLSSTRVPLWTYALATLIGMTPRTALMVYIASLVQNKTALEAKKSIPDWYLIVGVVTAVAVLIVLWYVADRALQKLTRAEPDIRA